MKFCRIIKDYCLEILSSKDLNIDNKNYIVNSLLLGLSSKEDRKKLVVELLKQGFYYRCFSEDYLEVLMLAEPSVVYKLINDTGTLTYKLTADIIDGKKRKLKLPPDKVIELLSNPDLYHPHINLYSCTGYIIKYILEWDIKCDPSILITFSNFVLIKNNLSSTLLGYKYCNDKLIVNIGLETCLKDKALLDSIKKTNDPIYLLKDKLRLPKRIAEKIYLLLEIGS